MNDWHALYEAPDPEREGWPAAAPNAQGTARSLATITRGRAAHRWRRFFPGSWPINASKGMGSVDALQLLVMLPRSAIMNLIMDLEKPMTIRLGGTHGAAAKAPLRLRKYL